jgi:hypothetical protein
MGGLHREVEKNMYLLRGVLPHRPPTANNVLQHPAKNSSGRGNFF